MVLLVLASVLFVGVTGAPDTCGKPDVERGSCVCNGVEYDLGTRMRPPAGQSFFAGEGPGKFMYYFQLTSGGLPWRHPGEMPHCTLPAGHAAPGNAAAQGQINGTRCFRLGRIEEQTWSIDSSGAAQVITLNFPGGEDGRATSVRVRCDRSRGEPAAFSAVGEVKQGLFQFELASKDACPPVENFRCVDNTCRQMPANYSGGGSEQACQDVCGPPTYHCINNRCTPAPGGVPRDECLRGCGPLSSS